MNNFDVNTYIDGIEMEEYLNSDFHSLTGQIEYWEVV